MAICAGIWIDHKKAIIVSLDKEHSRVLRMDSHVERHVRVKGGSRTPSPYGPQDVVSEKKRDERYKRQLREYYRGVIHAIRHARKVFIFGPGQAKIELEEEMQKKPGMWDKIAGIEPADKMTDAQIVAKVRKFYRAKHDQ